MSAINQTVVALQGAGGVAPYTFTILTDSQTTIAASLQGSTLTVDATAKEPGNYSVHVQIVDSVGNTTTDVIPVRVQDPQIFSILTTDLSFPPTALPYSSSTVLSSAGGNGAITWSLIPSITTLPGVALTPGGSLTFTLTQFGTWTLGLRAVDSLGNTASAVIEVSMNSGTAFSMVDGQIEIDVNVPTTSVGTHSFTLAVLDAAYNVTHQTFTYSAAQEISSVEPIEAAIDHFWGPGDTTSVVYPIEGDLTGFSLGQTSALLASNGLTASVDPVNKVITVSGPPSLFGNAEVALPIAIYRGNTQVALVTRTFTLISHSSTTDLANMTCTTKPYIVGEVVGLNPKKPYFNSPEIFSSATYRVRVQAGSKLPSGLSLDSVTGLIYGTVLQANVAVSVIEYVDANNTIHGTITIQWDIQSSAFPMVDTLTIGQLQAPYSALITGASSTPLTSVSLYRGRLPAGLLAAIDSSGTNVQITGSPTEAGYFDIWFRVTNSNGQVAFLYKRFAVSYISPLVILTDALQVCSPGQAYTQVITAFGGVPPYTWALSAGTLPAGLSFNSVSGEISGTTYVSNYAQSLTFTVTDARGVSSSASLVLTVAAALAISTTVLPIINSGQAYDFQLQATGGTSPYSWSLAAGSPALPSGISLSSTGILSGVSSQAGYSQAIVFEATDATNASVTKTLTLTVGNSTSLYIDTSGIGPIIKGTPYQGSASVSGLGAGPYVWSVTKNTANPLPAGMQFTGDQATLGQTATLSGFVTITLVNYSVNIQVVDANGNSATGFLILNTITSLTITTANPLPQASVGSPYSLQLTATGFNPPFVWAMASFSTPLPTGLSITSGGLLYGTPSVAFNGVLTFQVTDALGDTVTGQRTLVSRFTTLAITNTSLATIDAGFPYSVALNATGGTAPYTWAVSPDSVAQLPVGISLSTSSGILSGTTSLIGFTAQVTFRVTDSVGSYVERTLTVSVVAGLTIQSGIDYTLNVTTGLLGYCSGGDVTSINPRPLGSFLAVVTGVLATSTTTFSASLPVGYSVLQYQFLGGGVVVMQLSGPFGAAPVGTNNFSMTVTDSGVNVSTTLHWIVTADSVLRLAPASGSIPIQYLN